MGRAQILNNLIEVFGHVKWISTLSENSNPERALRECCQKISREVGDEPDLAVLFVSPHYAKSYAEIPTELFKLIRPKILIGCSGGGIIGGGRELEQKHGISLTCASLPNVEITPFHITNQLLPDMDAPPKAWQEILGVTPQNEPKFILLSDPFSIDVEKFAVGMDYAFPRSVTVGGLASGARGPGENALFLNHKIHHDGLIGVALSGEIQLDSVVAQGCRPIGEPMVITSCDQNILLELNEEPPMRILEGLYESLTPRDQELVRTSLFLGMVMDPIKESVAPGDFLIRNIVGADPEKGILAIGAELRHGQKVQFHLRDAKTSAEDLDLMLSRYSEKKGNAQGALLFSCLGRGVYLYGVPDHDTKIFQEKLGKIPLGGFFCNGEIGPVNRTTYIHGYTSCFGIFSKPA